MGTMQNKSAPSNQGTKPMSGKATDTTSMGTKNSSSKAVDSDIDTDNLDTDFDSSDSLKKNAGVSSKKSSNLNQSRK